MLAREAVYADTALTSQSVYAYDNRGNRITKTDTAGEYFDAETGFIYLRARYMDPQTGRFISEDPVGDGVNWYAYAAGNPVMLFDPSGLVVTAWDREHLTTYEQGLLSAYTNDWNNAYASGDEAGMNSKFSCRIFKSQIPNQ